MRLLTPNKILFRSKFTLFFRYSILFMMAEQSDLALLWPFNAEKLIKMSFGETVSSSVQKLHAID